MEFPRQTENVGGWTIDSELLRKIHNSLLEEERAGQLVDSVPSWEQIEMVLLSVESLVEDTTE